MSAVAGAMWASRRFPSSLIEPDVPISGIRLSDWFHRKAREEGTVAASGVFRRQVFCFALRYSFL